MEFLQEIVEWPAEELDRFIREWQIDADGYLSDALKLEAFLAGLKDGVDDYFEKGYEAFLFDEEATFLDQMGLKRDYISMLKEVQWTGNSDEKRWNVS